MEQVLDLSIIIVTYNTRDVVRDCLVSLREAISNIKAEVWVVDNESDDGTVDMVCAEFPEVRLVPLSENVGYSRANNIALRQARGAFILLLNPDTIVNAQALNRVLAFLRDNNRTGAAGCRLLRRNGSLDKACKRSFPTPANSLWQALGLDRCFPQSKVFGSYNLTYLDELGCYPIECLVGAFMMVRREVVETVGLLDERFFMYGEDIDWCKRIQSHGWEVYYLGDVQILHLKGESSRKQSYRMIREFHRAMYLYFQKHYRGRIHPITYQIVMAGITARWALACTKNAFRSSKRVS